MFMRRASLIVRNIRLIFDVTNFRALNQQRQRDLYCANFEGLGPDLEALLQSAKTVASEPLFKNNQAK